MKANKRISRTIGSGILVFLVMSLLTSMVVGTINERSNVLNESRVNQTVFYADIEITLFEGEGCGCFPLPDTLIFAEGQDTDHNDSGYTDEEGYVLLELEIDSTYRVMIMHDDYNDVLFDFIVVDDQYFSFHLEETVVSISQDSTIPSYSVRETELYTRLSR